MSVAEHGLWWDEQVSVSNAVGSSLSEPIVSSITGFTEQDFWAGNSLHNVIEATVLDGGNNLLHNVLLHYWINLWGTSDLSVRLLSAIFGVGVVLLVYLVALSLSSRKIAYYAGGLAALHPFLIRYGQEGRSYAMATFLTLAATFIFINLNNLNSLKFAVAQSWFLYSLLVSAALLSHYLTVYIFIGHTVYAALLIRDRKLWLNMIKAAVVVGIIFNSWMFAKGNRGLKVVAAINQSYQQRATNPSADENWALPATPRNIIAGLAQTIFAITGNHLQKIGLRLSRMIPLLFIPVLLLVVCWRFRVRWEVRPAALLLLSILAGSGIVFSTILALRSGHIISLQPLYSNFATPYLTILLAIGIAEVSSLTGLGRHAMIGILLFYATILLISIKLVYEDAPKYRTPNTYQLVSKQIRDTVLPGDAIVYSSWTEARLYNLYLLGVGTLRQRVDPTLKTDVIKIVRNGQTQLEINRAMNQLGK